MSPSGNLLSYTSSIRTGLGIPPAPILARCVVEPEPNRRLMARYVCTEKVVHLQQKVRQCLYHVSQEETVRPEAR